MVVCWVPVPSLMLMTSVPVVGAPTNSIVPVTMPEPIAQLELKNVMAGGDWSPVVRVQAGSALNTAV